MGASHHLSKQAAAARRQLREAAAVAYSADLRPFPDGPRESGRIPGRPHATINGMEVLPEVDSHWRPIHNRWALPGRVFCSTAQLRAMAALTGAHLEILTKE